MGNQCTTENYLETENNYRMLLIFVIKEKMTSAVIYSMLNRLIHATDSILSRILLETISYPSNTLQKVFIPSTILTSSSSQSYKQSISISKLKYDDLPIHSTSSNTQEARNIENETFLAILRIFLVQLSIRYLLKNFLYCFLL